MNLLEAITTTLDSKVMGRVSALLGEQERRLWPAVEQFAPAITAAVINFTATEDGATRFLQMLTSGRHEGVVLGELEGLMTNRISAFSMLAVGEKASEILLGAHLAPVTRAVAEETRLTYDTALEVLNLVMLVVLELLGSWRSSHGSSDRELMEWIQIQRGTTARSLPAEVGRFIELYENPTQQGHSFEMPGTLRRLKLFLLRG